jgi:hypothetical protein
MSWFKVDDGFASHLKVEKLREICDTDALFTAAITVWTLMGSDCAARSPSGTFSAMRLRQVVQIAPATAAKACAKLVECGLFDHIEGPGSQFHDFAVYNGTPEEAAERKAKREALSATRRDAGSKGGKQTQANRQATGAANAVANGQQTGAANDKQHDQATLTRAPAGGGMGRDSESSEGSAEGGELTRQSIDPDAIVWKWSTDSDNRIPNGASLGQLLTLRDLMWQALDRKFRREHIEALGEWANPKGANGFGWMERRSPDIKYLLDADGGNFFSALNDSREWFESKSRPKVKPVAVVPPPPTGPLAATIERPAFMRKGAVNE